MPPLLSRTYAIGGELAPLYEALFELPEVRNCLEFDRGKYRLRFATQRRPYCAQRHITG